MSSRRHEDTVDIILACDSKTMILGTDHEGRLVEIVERPNGMVHFAAHLDSDVKHFDFCKELSGFQYTQMEEKISFEIRRDDVIGYLVGRVLKAYGYRDTGNLTGYFNEIEDNIPWITVVEQHTWAAYEDGGDQARASAQVVGKENMEVLAFTRKADNSIDFHGTDNRIVDLEIYNKRLYVPNVIARDGDFMKFRDNFLTYDTHPQPVAVKEYGFKDGIATGHVIIGLTSILGWPMGDFYRGHTVAKSGAIYMGHSYITGLYKLNERELTLSPYMPERRTFS